MKPLQRILGASLLALVVAATAGSAVAAPRVGDDGRSDARAVTVGQDGGTLEIAGDGGSDLVTLTSVDADSVDVDGVQYDGVNAVTVDLGGGDDTLTIVNNGVLFAPAEGIFYDGNAGFDTLVYEGSGGDLSASYTFGPGNDEGGVTYSDGDYDQAVTYDGIEPIVDLVPAGLLIVNGTNADNAISYTTGSVAANGLVSVDGFETIEFSNKAILTINGLAGDDTISLNNPIMPIGLAQIEVSGGEPTASDRVVLNGTSGADVVTFQTTGTSSASVTGAGPVLIALQEVEEAHYNGQGGGDVFTFETPLDPDEIILTPGVVSDAGTIVAHTLGASGHSLLSPSYEGLGANGSLTFADASATRDDQLLVNGRNNANQDDLFRVTLSGLIQILEGFVPNFVTVPVSTPGVSIVSLHGLEGDDRFEVAGGHPFEALFVEGSGADNADTLEVTAAAAANLQAELDLARVVQVPGVGAVGYSGLARVELNVSGGGVATILGGAGNDEFEAWTSPSGERFIQPAGAPLFVVPVGDPVVVDGAGGADRLQILGTPANDLILVDDDDVIVNGVSVGYISGTLEQLWVLGDSGPDTITSTATRPLHTYGGLGFDTMTGGPGEDVMFGDVGFDILNGGGGPDQIFGGPGDDVAIGGPGNDSFAGEDGLDTFTWNPGDGSDNIDGGDGQDVHVFNGNGGAEQFFVHAGSTTVEIFRVQAAITMQLLGFEELRLNALAGADTITVDDLFETELRLLVASLGPGDLGGDSVEINGRNVPDVLETSIVAGPAVEVTGLTYDFHLVDYEAADVLSVRGREGSDALSAGPGVQPAITLFLFGDLDNDTLSGNAAILGGGPGDDTVTGGDLGNLLTGDDGNDQIFGLGGADDVGGGPGADTVVGGPGGDTVQGGAGDDLLVWNNGDGSDVMDGDGDNDRVQVNGSPSSGDEFLIQPNAGRVRLDRTNFGPFTLDIGTTEILEVNGLGGSDLIDALPGLGGLILLELNGNEGQDAIFGADGADLISGGPGADFLRGGSGDDLISGDAGHDDISGDDGADQLSGDSGVDLFTWFINDGDDEIDGGTGLDQLNWDGRNGVDDVEIGGLATFTFIERVASPVFVFADNIESIVVNGRGGADQIEVVEGFSYFAKLEILGGGGGDHLLGGDGNDILSGGGGADQVLGRDGNDHISGGAGEDELFGGADDDRFNAGDEEFDRVSGGAGYDEATLDIALDDFNAVEEFKEG
jgi:Ca2+-binding RTX toxin-like protein